MQTPYQWREAFPMVVLLALAVAAVGCSTMSSKTSNSGSFSEGLRRISADRQWLTYGHDYSNDRFSPLKQINVSNVERLVPAYVAHTGVVGPFETSPIVAGFRDVLNDR